MVAAFGRARDAFRTRSTPRRESARARPRRSSAASRATAPDYHEVCARISGLLRDASAFVAPERGDLLLRRLLPRHDPAPSAEMKADAALLVADLAPSLPSMAGTTALDRLTQQRGGAADADAAALTALRAARYRLLRLEQAGGARECAVVDALSGERLRLVCAELVRRPSGTVLFGRVAPLGGAACFVAGAAMPLDAAGETAARGHAAAGAPGAAANARWAEAVYAHAVRNGTRRQSGPDVATGDRHLAAGAPLLALVRAWQAAGRGGANEALLLRTRQMSDLATIVDALLSACVRRDTQAADYRSAFDRMLTVMLETVSRRERGGSGMVTLDGIAQRLAATVEAGALVPEAQAYFAELRKRLGADATGHRPADDELERLVARIQALRAKTVEHGCTEQEALAAAEKVAELLDRHGLSLDALDYEAQPCEGTGVQTDRRRAAPIDHCVHSIAAYFDCKVWVERARGEALRYVFFGLRGDVAGAHYLYALVERTFETETEAFRASRVYERATGDRRAATNSFQMGLAHGINGKLKAQQAARGARLRRSAGRDLVPVKAAMINAELAKLGLHLRARQAGRGTRLRADAFLAGRDAAGRFDVTPGLTKAA